MIFDKSNFLSVYTNDIINAAREILIVSPFVTKKTYYTYDAVSEDCFRE